MGGCLSSLSQIIDRDGAVGNNPEAQMLYLISFFDPPKLFQVRKIPGEARIPHLGANGRVPLLVITSIFFLVCRALRSGVTTDAFIVTGCVSILFVSLRAIGNRSG